MSLLCGEVSASNYGLIVVFYCYVFPILFSFYCIIGRDNTIGFKKDPVRIFIRFNT